MDRLRVVGARALAALMAAGRGDAGGGVEEVLDLVDQVVVPQVVRRGGGRHLSKLSGGSSASERAAGARRDLHNFKFKFKFKFSCLLKLE